MTKKFKNKYRIESTRLAGWDYCSPGYYFITICTKNRKCYFGDIWDGKMYLSPAGKIVRSCWKEIPQHFQHTFLDQYIVMPNHLHGIVVIDNGTEAAMPLFNSIDAALPRLNDKALPRLNYHLPKPNSMSVIIGSFKSIATREIRFSAIPDFYWQPRFYDHIIRNDKSLDKIKEYIIYNPLKWEWDRNNQKYI